MTANPATSGLSYAKLTDRGKLRETNEDCGIAEPWPDGNALLVVLADGMGGHAGGGVASEIVIDCFRKLLDSPVPKDRFDRYEGLLGCFYAADDAIKKRAAADFALLNMGATVVASILTSSECFFLYAGDCRLFHLRDGAVIFVTADHSVVRTLVDNGNLAPDEVRQHPMRSIVTSSVGSSPNSRLHVDPKWNEASGDQPAFRELRPGDTLLFCTDGLSSEVALEDLTALSSRCRSGPGELARVCITAALNEGGKDNVTVVVVDVSLSQDGLVGYGAFPEIGTHEHGLGSESAAQNTAVNLGPDRINTERGADENLGQ